MGEGKKSKYVVKFFNKKKKKDRDNMQSGITYAFGLVKHMEDHLVIGLKIPEWGPGYSGSRL